MEIKYYLTTEQVFEHLVRVFGCSGLPNSFPLIRPSTHPVTSRMNHCRHPHRDKPLNTRQRKDKCMPFVTRLDANRDASRCTAEHAQFLLIKCTNHTINLPPKGGNSKQQEQTPRVLLQRTFSSWKNQTRKELVSSCIVQNVIPQMDSLEKLNSQSR